MDFMVWIIEELQNAEDWFHDAYVVVRDWVYPFSLLEYPIYGLYGVFKWLVEDFYDFYLWLEEANALISDILSWGNIQNLIRSWLIGIEDALSWFRNWTTYIGQYIADWWSSILPLVLAYVDSALAGLGDFAATWDNFWNNIFPGLVTFEWLTSWWNGKLTEVNSLINSWFIAFTPFWEGWQDVREEVIAFFSDPLQWIYDKLDEFFERFW